MSARKEYLKLIETRINEAEASLLIDWLNDLDRKPAVNAFTEGATRNVAYAIEKAIKIAKETDRLPNPPAMKPYAVCPRCGYMTYDEKVVSQKATDKQDTVVGDKLGLDGLAGTSVRTTPKGRQK